MGTGASFPEGKAAWKWCWHSPPSSAEVKNGGSIPPVGHTSSWLGTYIIKHRDISPERECVSESRYDRRSIGQSVLVLSPILGSWPDINYYLTITVLSMSGAPSNERSGLSFVLVTWTASVQFSQFSAGPRQLLILTRRRATVISTFFYLYL
jgi:hypothetical protein